MKTPLSIIIACTIFLFAGCDKNPYKKDVSDIDVDVKMQMFHRDIQGFTDNPTDAYVQELQNRYGEFLTSYLIDMKRMFCPDVPDTAYTQIVRAITSDKWNCELYSISDSAFSAQEETYRKEIHTALQYFKSYFPEKEIPELYTFITGINYSMAIDSGIIAIGIDKYLGKDNDFYNSLIIDSYIKENMRPEKLVPDLMRALAESEFPNMFEETYLLAQMLQCGRYQYFVRCMLPEVPDTILWGYTGKQLEFCEKSEGEFWKYFISTENLLFSTDYMVHKRFIDDGPFTSVFTKESPARIGQWMGFKIIESFMKNNPDVTLPELFKITSSKEIISKAKYNPK